MGLALCAQALTSEQRDDGVRIRARSPGRAMHRAQDISSGPGMVGLSLCCHGHHVVRPPGSHWIWVPTLTEQLLRAGAVTESPWAVTMRSLYGQARASGSHCVLRLSPWHASRRRRPGRRLGTRCAAAESGRLEPQQWHPKAPRRASGSQSTTATTSESCKATARLQPQPWPRPYGGAAHFQRWRMVGI